MTRHIGLLIVAGLTALLLASQKLDANPADGTWHFYGFQAAGTDLDIPSPERIDGVAEVGPTGIQLSIGSESENFVLPWQLTESGYFLNQLQDVSTPPAEADVVSQGTFAKIVLIDNQTALFIYGQIGYLDYQIDWPHRNSLPISLDPWEYDWICGVLSRTELPLVTAPYPDPPDISGKYAIRSVGGFADNREKGVTEVNGFNGLKLIALESGGYLVDTEDGNAGAGQSILSPTGPPGEFILSDSLATPEHVFNSYFAWRDPDSNTLHGDQVNGYILDQKDEVHALALGDGRLFLCGFLAATGNATIETDQSEVWSTTPPILYDVEFGGQLATPSNCGVFDEVTIQASSSARKIVAKDHDANPVLIRGDVFVVRNGQTIRIKQGDLLYEGDVIQTSEKSFIKIVFIDKSQMNVGPNSKMKVEKFNGKDSSVISLIKGKIRSQVTKDYLQIKNKDKSKLFIKTDNAIFGVRGTTFEVELSELDGQITTLLTMIEGAVEATNLLTGASTMVTGTETWSAASPSTGTIQVTLQAPGPVGGKVHVDGHEYTLFPVSFAVARGTELHLRAEAAESSRFYRWWSADGEDLAPEIYVTCLYDQAITCDFLPMETSAIDDYDAETSASGLTGDDAEFEATPFSDGVPNLLKYASGIDLYGSNIAPLKWGEGNSGLPAFRSQKTGCDLTAEFQFVRRTDGGFIYRPLVSSDCESWRGCRGPENVVPLGNGWERVTVSEKANRIDPSEGGGNKMFFRMLVRAVAD